VNNVSGTMIVTDGETALNFSAGAGKTLTSKRIFFVF